MNFRILLLLPMNYSGSDRPDRGGDISAALIGGVVAAGVVASLGLFLTVLFLILCCARWRKMQWKRDSEYRYMSSSTKSVLWCIGQYWYVSMQSTLMLAGNVQ